MDAGMVTSGPQTMRLHDVERQKSAYRESLGSSEKDKAAKHAAAGPNSSSTGRDIIYMSLGHQGQIDNTIMASDGNRTSSKQGKMIRCVREKARLLEEVRQNKERAIEHAHAQVEAQQRRKRRAEAGALNFSMRFEGVKDMKKFERHVEDVFSKKKARSTNRNAFSIDFSRRSPRLNQDLGADNDVSNDAKTNKKEQKASVPVNDSETPEQIKRGS